MHQRVNISGLGLQIYGLMQKYDIPSKIGAMYK